tara:strand:+ start:486 stop:1154 length:669 start_codon:yes stop_codon:yes gene_type:complete
MLDRIKHAKTIDKIVICTSTNPQDNPLEKIAKKENVICHRGSEDDVLVRLLEAAKKHDLKHFANFTADCPMIDPNLIDHIVMNYHNSEADLLKYDDCKDDVPFGCYVIRVNALEMICREKKQTDTEVWIKLFTTNPDLVIRKIKVDSKYHHKTLKTSLDYPEDYEFIEHVFAELYQPGKFFTMLDILNLVRKKPELLEINSSRKLISRWKNHKILSSKKVNT